jgi:preprotein translocase subunit SecD
LEEAIEMIGRTPHLEFMLLKEDFDPMSFIEFDINPENLNENVTEDGVLELSPNGPSLEDMLVATGLSGRFIQRAQLEFDSFSREPYVSLSFNREGREMFAEITRENIGEVLAIVLDGEPISMPVIREEIRDGNAMISGGFTALEARELVRNINLGALPVPIELVSTQTVGASLGQDVVEKGIFAGILGLSLVALFLIFWYRLPGFIAVVSLSIYVLAMLALFKLIPVTLTAAGIAGFILSIGMAVDANILIFERMKEELRKGKGLGDAVNEGFARAWLAIRDGNISSIITAIVLFYFGTAMVLGFALTFGIGVLVSMITAISVTRTFLMALGQAENKGAV